MAAPYIRKCKSCGARIRMAEVDNGQWLPFEVEYNGGRHHCTSTAAVRVEATAAATFPEPMRPGPSESRIRDGDDRDGHSINANPAIGCLVLLAMLVMAIAYIGMKVYGFIFGG